ncbi:DUF222 domain-containing protein [uncultured Jatrophihabitans sp.]|uniref:HNH endonuclease signature motif containing protein n=1 Tax=uncultured Jatrophihabitans sp. TaxID=1610747 RepID=UPI0035CA81D0
MGEDVVSSMVGPLRAALDHLLDASLTMLGSVEVTQLLRELEVQRRRLVAVDHRVLGEVDERGVAGEYARSSTADLLVQMLRVTPAEAKARVRQARAVQPNTTLTGAVTPAVLPRCAAAARAGEISAAHITVIATATDRVSRRVAHEVVPVCEQLLVQAARHQHPGALAQTADMLLARLDPDGRAPDDAELERRRGFTLARRGRGSSRPSGEWTAELTALWDAILDALAAPQPAADGGPDDRSPAQRRHDAMIDAGKRLLRSADLPTAGGAPVTVLLRMPAQDLTGTDEGDGGGAHARVGVAQSANGDLWPTALVQANLTDAAIVPIVVDHHGAVLFCGRTKRLATPALRYALAARDGGCCFPGCERPAAWCEAHHIREWTDGGPTDIDNLCLLCRYHHRQFARHGWHVQMINGRPHWIPPAFIDPQQTPVHNTVHHAAEIDFPIDVDVGLTG